MKTITLFVTRQDDGFYVATAQEESIITQAKTLDELIKNIDEVVALHFEHQSMPPPYTLVMSSTTVHAAEV